MNRGFWIWAVNALNESELKARMKRIGLRVNIVTVGGTRRTSMERFASTSGGRPVLRSSNGRGRPAANICGNGISPDRVRLTNGLGNDARRPIDSHLASGRHWA